MSLSDVGRVADEPRCDTRAKTKPDHKECIGRSWLSGVRSQAGVETWGLVTCW